MGLILAHAKDDGAFAMAGDRKLLGLQAALSRVTPVVNSLLATRRISQSKVNYSEDADGLSLRIVGRLGLDDFKFGFKAALNNGAFVFSHEGFLRDLDAALKASAANCVLPAEKERVLAVDLTKVRAKLAGGTVFYRNEDLPTWSFSASASDLNELAGRKSTAESLVASIRSLVSVQYGAKAVFATEHFSLPQAQVPAPAVKASFNPEEIQAEVTFNNMVRAGVVQSKSSDKGFQASDATYRRQERVRAAAKFSVQRALSSKLDKGHSVSIQSIDMSSLAEDMGYLNGDAKITASYVSKSKGKVLAEVVVPFVRGAVQEAKITFSPAHLEAEKKEIEAAKIWSEAEAKKYWDDLKASVSKGSVQASMPGDSFMNPGPMERIPMAKYLFAVDTKPGDEVQLNGFVYQICATNYHSVDIDHSAYWMLALLKDKMPSKQPNIAVWA